jgi:hypothetical protein
MPYPDKIQKDKSISERICSYLVRELIKQLGVEENIVSEGGFSAMRFFIF